MKNKTTDWVDDVISYFEKSRIDIIEQSNIGKAKYVVSYHHSNRKHPDGSLFYDIATFKNKQKKNAFIKQLITNNK